MAGLKASELRATTAEELRQKREELQRQLAELRLKAAQGAVEQPHRIRQMKRDLARIQTVMHEPR